MVSNSPHECQRINGLKKGSFTESVGRLRLREVAYLVLESYTQMFENSTFVILLARAEFDDFFHRNQVTFHRVGALSAQVFARMVHTDVAPEEVEVFFDLISSHGFEVVAQYVIEPGLCNRPKCIPFARVCWVWREAICSAWSARDLRSAAMLRGGNAAPWSAMASGGKLLRRSKR